VQSFGDDNAWHERQLVERRLPTREELDHVVDDRPLFLLRGPDVAALNSMAVAELKPLIEQLPDVVLDGATGLLRGADIRLLQGDLRPPAPSRRPEILREACDTLLSVGIAAVVDPGLPARFAETWATYRDATERGALPLRVELMNRLDYRLPFEEEFARVQEERIVPLAGDDQLRVFGLKLILDGEFANAWVRSGEAEGVVPDRRYSANEVDAILDLCCRRGWPCCIHVMGGAAIDFVVERMKEAIARGNRFYPYQLSLAHVFLPSKENLVDCARLGIALSVQPLLTYVFEHEMSAAWGDVAQRSNPYATMKACALLPAGGSDVLPCEPLRGAQVAVTRRAREGSIFGSDEALTPREAIELFTSSAGLYMRHFDRGRIAAGFVADVAVWNENPLHVDPEDWPTLRARLVAIGGEVTYES
jgi:predicted amidohydrolase YtcJ